MSLGGIAIAIGALVDAAVVVVENAHKKLEAVGSRRQEGGLQRGPHRAIQEVGRPSFFSLMVIALSFMPVFALEAQEGRLFKPLAFTKNFAMAIAAFLAITLDPALRLLFTRMKEFEFRPRWLAKATNAIVVGRMYPEEKHPISRILIRLYTRPAKFVLKHPRMVIGDGGCSSSSARFPIYSKARA